MTQRPATATKAPRRRDAGTALVAALIAMALAGGAAVLFAELARTTLVRARVDRDGVAAWYLAETGLAETVAALTAGSAFSTDLAAHAGTPPAPVAGAYAATFTDDHEVSAI